MNATGPTPSDPFDWSRLWPFSLMSAPVVQSILPGWSLISVNEGNSSAPDTERRIIAQDSYGRQLGRLLDAVTALIDERPAGSPACEAFDELAILKARIDTAKLDAAAARLRQIGGDLGTLRLNRPDEYERQVAALRALLG